MFVPENILIRISRKLLYRKLFMFSMSDIDVGIIKNMIDCSLKIEQFISDFHSYLEFENDIKTSDAVLMNLIVIGEQSAKLSTQFKKNYNRIPWKNIKGLRNIIAHHYFGVNYENIWKNCNN